MPQWREASRLFGLADVAVAARGGTDRRAVDGALAPLLAGARLTFLDAPLLDVSSSQARERASRGEPPADLVGAPVAEYIATHRLYQPEALAG
jgi:nicotinate-nucleotide adenylyltransferase